MYVLYNIQGNVLLTKLMRKLYQILYTVGRLTYAPARRAFFFLGDTWAVGFSLSGGHLGSGRFPFRGTLEQWAFPFQGDTWAVGVSLSGGHLSSGRFPFRGTLWRGQVCEGERRSELRSPLFPLALPLSGHVAVLRCGMLQCIGKCLYAAVLAMYSCADGCVET